MDEAPRFDARRSASSLLLSAALLAGFAPAQQPEDAIQPHRRPVAELVDDLNDALKERDMSRDGEAIKLLEQLSDACDRDLDKKERKKARSAAASVLLKHKVRPPSRRELYAAAVEVLTKLKEVQKAPAEAEYLRQTIVCGLRLKGEGAMHASSLLSFWTGDEPAADDADWETAMKAWQDWYARKYPNKPAAELPAATTKSRWEVDELLKFLASSPGKVFTRETLLSRVWGYDYYGGARTVDVHVRRLRAKMGEAHASLIQTVRSVGYSFGQSRWSG